MTKITKAVLPAAGFGTRFLPATKATPKEMLPIVDKPTIQYLVEEAVASGIQEIIVITGSGKRSIEDHFDHAFELEAALQKKGKDELLKQVRELENMAKFVYVRQPQPRGDGDAILRAKEVIGNEPFAVLFGDDIVDNEQKPALKQLIEQHEKTGCSVIALEKVPDEDVSSYGIIKPASSEGRLHEIESMVEKPAQKDAPSNLGIIGKYVVTPEVLKALENASSGHSDGEIRLIDGFIAVQKSQKVYGYEIEGQRFDAGNKLGMLMANIHYALKRDDLGPELKAYLKSLD